MSNGLQALSVIGNLFNVVQWSAYIGIYLAHELSGDTELSTARAQASLIITLVAFPLTLAIALVYEYETGSGLSFLFPSQRKRKTSLADWRTGLSLQANIGSLVISILLSLLFTADLRSKLRADDLPLFTPLTGLQVLLSTIALTGVNIVLFLYALIGSLLFPANNPAINNKER
jgi:hypothetical protein